MKRFKGLFVAVLLFTSFMSLENKGEAMNTMRVQDFCAGTYFSCGAYGYFCADSPGDYVDHWEMWDNFVCN